MAYKNYSTSVSVANKTVAYGHGHPKKLVFHASGLSFFGASQYFARATMSDGVFIDLDNNIEPNMIGVYGFKPKHIGKWAERKVIKLDWPDMGVMPFGIEFWESLIEELHEMKGKREMMEVIVTCYGGHGRTGTVLAILAALTFQTSRPISFVRRRMCRDCIESKAQVDYVKYITGTREIVEESLSAITYIGNQSKGTIYYKCGMCEKTFEFPSGTPYVTELKCNVCDDCYTEWRSLSEVESQKKMAEGQLG